MLRFVLGIVIETVSTTPDHSLRDSILKLILMLLGCGIYFILAASLFGGAALIALSIIKPIVESMGGSILIVRIGWGVGFLIAIVVIIAGSWLWVWVSAMIEERWPNNPVKQLVEWVKDSPPTSSTSDW